MRETSRFTVARATVTYLAVCWARHQKFTLAAQWHPFIRSGRFRSTAENKETRADLGLGASCRARFAGCVAAGCRPSSCAMQFWTVSQYPPMCRPVGSDGQGYLPGAALLPTRAPGRRAPGVGHRSAPPTPPLGSSKRRQTTRVNCMNGARGASPVAIYDADLRHESISATGDNCCRDWRLLHHRRHPSCPVLRHAAGCTKGIATVG